MDSQSPQKKSVFWPSGNARSGQAIIEYILVVTVTVIIIGALVERMFTPMNKFMGSLMGTYIECLLETGELPRLGADSEDSSGVCQIDMMAEGERSSPTDPRRNQNQNKSDDDDADSDKVETASSAPNRSRASSGGGQASSVRQTFRLGGPPGGMMGIDGRSRGRGAIDLGDGAAAVNAGSWGSSGGGNRRPRRDRPVMISGYYSEQIAKKEREKEAGRLAPPAGENTGSGAPKKLSMKVPERKVANQEEFNAGGLRISDIIKWVLIAGIIIIIVVLLGGQFLQLSKSWEKGE